MYTKYFTKNSAKNNIMVSLWLVARTDNIAWSNLRVIWDLHMSVGQQSWTKLYCTEQQCPSEQITALHSTAPYCIDTKLGNFVHCAMSAPVCDFLECLGCHCEGASWQMVKTKPSLELSLLHTALHMFILSTLQPHHMYCTSEIFCWKHFKSLYAFLSFYFVEPTIYKKARMIQLLFLFYVLFICF